MDHSILSRRSDARDDVWGSVVQNLLMCICGSSAYWGLMDLSEYLRDKREQSYALALLIFGAAVLFRIALDYLFPSHSSHSFLPF